MFVIPLCGVFLLALLGVTSGEFAQFMQKRMMIIKVLLAVLFLGLGLVLVWRI
jgi:threonine/homoserine/homoserine lactone efflux protein